MKLHRFGAFAALVAGTAFIACSSNKTEQPSGEDASVSFAITTTEGVVIASVDYDLNTQAGADVANGSIPVPNADSAISLGIESLPAPGDYSLVFSAVGLYQGEQVTCVSTPALFSLASGQELTLPTVNLVCAIENVVPDTTGSVAADVNVVVEQINVGGNIVEVFSYGPRLVRGVDEAGVCVYPPIALQVFNNDTSISYSWSAAPDGVLALDATNTSGTYTCESGGTKMLTLTATQGTTTSSKSVTVTCDDTNCGVVVPLCGNGQLDTGEECDENTARCQNCTIVPVCGDGVTDGPDGVCAGGTQKATCIEECDTAGPTATCDANCQIIEDDPVAECRECLTTDPNIAGFQTTYCDPVPDCTAVQSCVIAAGCFSPIPALCYCGTTDVEACEAPDFVPTGPCVNELRVGLGNSPDNATALERIFDFNFPGGVGMLALNEAATFCPDACF